MCTIPNQPVSHGTIAPWRMAGALLPKKRPMEGGDVSQYFGVFSTQQWAEESRIRSN